MAPPLALPSPPPLAPLVVVSARGPTTVVTVSPPRHCGGDDWREEQLTDEEGEPILIRYRGVRTWLSLMSLMAYSTSVTSTSRLDDR